jgi:hypothetical protein
LLKAWHAVLVFLQTASGQCAVLHFRSKTGADQEAWELGLVRIPTSRDRFAYLAASVVVRHFFGTCTIAQNRCCSLPTHSNATRDTDTSHQVTSRHLTAR